MHRAAPLVALALLAASLLSQSSAWGAEGARLPEPLYTRTHAAALALQNSGPELPLLMGVYQPPLPNDLQSVELYELLAQRRLGIVHWYAIWGGWKRDFDVRDLELTSSRGSVPMITWEPWDGESSSPDWSLKEAVLSGRNDAYIASWARGMADYGQPVLLRFAHEMHDSHFPWSVGTNGNTPEDFVASWHHIRNVFRDHGATNVLWVWNPNAIGDAAPEIFEPMYRALYPGDDAVDLVGLDVYDTGPDLDWGAPYWRSLHEILAGPYQALDSITAKPIVLAEVGSARHGEDKAAWIRDGLGPSLPQRFPRVRGVVWFDVLKEQPWAIHTGDAALGAFIDTWREPHFGNAESIEGSFSIPVQ